MKIIREGTATLQNDQVDTFVIEREVALLVTDNGPFIVVNADRVMGESGIHHIHKSHLFANEALADRWFDKLMKDGNL